MKERLKEIVEILDCNVYLKNCNFLDEDILENEGVVQFYSRDYCRNISFRELLQWYLSRLYYNDYLDDMEESEEKWNEDVKYAIEQEKLFMELVDIYVFYNSKDYIKHRALLTKLNEIIAQEK